MKIFGNVIRSLVRALLYYKIITKTLVNRPLCNSFNFENREQDSYKTVMLIII